MSEEFTPVYCNKHSEKLLAKLDDEGLRVWCKECKTYHIVSWALLQQTLQRIEQDHMHTPIKAS